MTAGSEISAGRALSKTCAVRDLGPVLNLRLKKMPIASPRYAFNATMVAGAPPDPGVFALWEHDELICYGRALGQGATIQSCLREHLAGGERCTSRATHYGWEITSNPRARERELLREFERSHGRLPRCNAKAA
jgi:hypothetical protein